MNGPAPDQPTTRLPATPTPTPGPGRGPRPPLSPLGHALVTTFGLGHCRPASGTWGSLPPVILAVVLVQAGYRPGMGQPAWLVYHAALLAQFALFFTACIVYGAGAEARFGKKDPGQVVADETACVCLPLMFLPAASLSSTPRAAVTLFGAFLLFRVFDILKLPPAHGLQRFKGGLGIVMDDVVAGLQAMAVLQVATRLLW